MIKVAVDITDINHRLPLTGIPSDTWWVFYMLANSKKLDTRGLIGLGWPQSGYVLNQDIEDPAIVTDLYSQVVQMQPWFGMPMIERFGQPGKLVSKLIYAYYYLRRKEFNVLPLPEDLHESVLLNYLNKEGLTSDQLQKWIKRTQTLKHYLMFASRRILTGRPGSPLRYKLSKDVTLKWSKDKPDIVYLPEVFRIKLNPDTLYIVRIHDWIPLTHPDTVPGRTQIYHRYLVIKEWAQRVPHNLILVANSKFTEEYTLKFFPQLKGKVKTIYIPVPDLFNTTLRNTTTPDLQRILSNKTRSVYKTFKLQPPHAKYAEWFENHLNQVTRNIKEYKYFFSVSSLDPRKNYEGLIIAFEKFLSRLTPEEQKKTLLILRAAYGWKQKGIVKLMAKLERQGNLLHIADYLTYTELAIMNANAYAFAFVSFVEGFGMSPIEAMATGTPVVSSDTPIHRELQKDNAIFVNPYDTDDMANGLYKIYKDKKLHKQLSQKGAEYIDKTLRLNIIQKQWEDLLSKEYDRFKKHR